MERPIVIIATDISYHNIIPWEKEGYDITHISKASQRSLEDATDDIEPHRKYAIIGMLSSRPLQMKCDLTLEPARSFWQCGNSRAFSSHQFNPLTRSRDCILSHFASAWF